MGTTSEGGAINDRQHDRHDAGKPELPLEGGQHTNMGGSGNVVDEVLTGPPEHDARTVHGAAPALTGLFANPTPCSYFCAPSSGHWAGELLAGAGGATEASWQCRRSKVVRSVQQDSIQCVLLQCLRYNKAWSKRFEEPKALGVHRRVSRKLTDCV